jgi:hypothetical protein
VTVTNTGADASRITVDDAESIRELGLSVDGTDLTRDGFVLAGGESADVTLELPPDFESDDEITVRFRRTPSD